MVIRFYAPYVINDNGNNCVCGKSIRIDVKNKNGDIFCTSKYLSESTKLQRQEKYIERNKFYFDGYFEFFGVKRQATHKYGFGFQK